MWVVVPRGAALGAWLVGRAARGGRRVPGTVLLVGFTGALALFQHVLAPAVGVPTGGLVDRFAAHSTAPTAVGTWVTAPLLHLSVVHFLKNVGPLLVVGGYLEARYGTLAWFVTCAAVGALGHGAFATLVALTVETPWFFVGASTIWYGLVAFLALNGDALSLPVPGASDPLAVPFRYCFGVCLGYTVVSAAAGGVLTPGIVPTLHLVSLAVGACWWALAEAVATPRSRRGRPSSRRRRSSSGR